MSAPSEKHTLDSIKGAKARKEIAELLAEQARWKRIRTEAEENIKLATELLIPKLINLGITNILAPDDQGTDKVFIVTNGTNVSIKRELLLLRNVDPQIIEDCTVRTQYQSLQVRKAG